MKPGFSKCAILLILISLAILPLSKPVWANAAPPVDHIEEEVLPSKDASLDTAISAAIGRDDTAYHFKKDGNGYTAEGSGQAPLHARFDSSSALVDASGIRWDMRLQGWGYGRNIQALDCAGSPTAEANRLEYRCDRLVEWYLNGPNGIEQGFTVSEPPLMPANGEPLTFVLHLGENRAEIDPGGRQVRLLSPGGSSLTFGGLKAYDAERNDLAIWFDISRVSEQKLLIRVDDRGARYPLTVDPLVHSEKLIPSTAGWATEFGYSVAINSDGTVAAVGAPAAHDDEGRVYCFIYDDGKWRLRQQVIYPGDVAPGDRFGTSVALSESGDVLIVGSPGKDNGQKVDSGAAYFYHWDVERYFQKQTVTGEASYDYFGYSVAANRDGSIIVVGAYGNDSSGRANAGRIYAYVQETQWNWLEWGWGFSSVDAAAGDYFGYSIAFAKNYGEYCFIVGAPKADINGRSNQGAAYLICIAYPYFNQEKKFTASDGAAGDWFGASVSISGDGDTVAIGAPNADVNGKPDQGAVYAFVKYNGSWHQGKMTASDGGANDHLGISVAAGANGLSVLAGSYRSDTAGKPDSGAAYYFTRTMLTNWSEKSKTLPSNSESCDQFGVSVAISTDNTTAIIGASKASLSGFTNFGNAFIYNRSGTIWNEQVNAAGLTFYKPYQTVALSKDGTTMLVGMPGYADGKGAVFVFVRSGDGWIQQARLVLANQANYEGFGASLDLSENGDMAVIGAPEEASLKTGKETVYVFRRIFSTWVLDAELVASDGGGNDDFGGAVAIDGEGKTVIVGARKAGDSYHGAAYIYVKSESGWNQQAKIIAAESGDDDALFGSAVSLSADGNTALIGASYRNRNGTIDQGAAYIFTRSGSSWSQQAELYTADGNPLDLFGSSAEISADGKWALVGAPHTDNGSIVNQGAAYVFEKSGSNWILRKKFQLADGDHWDTFGTSVDISADGSGILIGSPGTEDDLGAVYYSERVGGSWTALTKYIADVRVVNDRFGEKVSLAGDGLSFVAGAPGAHNNLGAAYIFDRSRTSLVLSAPNSPTVYGQAVALRASVSSTAGKPQGTVSFMKQSGQYVIYLGQANINAEGVAEFITDSPPLPGMYTYLAEYQGSSSFYPSSGIYLHQVTPGSTSLAITGVTPSSLVVGDTVLVSVTVSPVPPSVIVPAGKVFVWNSDGEYCTAELESGSGSCGLKMPSPGVRTIYASYPGSGGYTGSTAEFVQYVDKADTTITIESITPSPSVVDEPVSVQVKLATDSPDAGSINGTIMVSEGVGNSCYISYPTSDSCSLVFTTAGEKTITASFSGSYLFNPSQAASAHTVNAGTAQKMGTVTTIEEITPSPSLPGQKVMVTFKVSAKSGFGLTPDGDVTVMDPEGASCSGKLTDGGGNCELILMETGSREIIAFYSGSGWFLSSEGSKSHTVNKIGTTTTVTAHTPDPAIVGEPVTVEVEVTPEISSAGVVKGIVTVTAEEGNSCAINLLKMDSCDLVFSTPGKKTITAEYLGNSTFLPSSTNFEHTVNAAPATYPTVTTISSHSPEPSLVGQEVQVEVSVSAAFSFLHPSGEVTVSDGQRHSCSAKLANGSASCRLKLTNLGRVRIFAEYQGNDDFAPSQTSLTHLVVRPRTTTMITEHTPSPSQAGESITVRVKVISDLTCADVNIGIVRIRDDEGHSCEVDLAVGQSCNLLLTSDGEKTITAVYLGCDQYEGSEASVSHFVGDIQRFIFLPLIVR